MDVTGFPGILEKALGPDHPSAATVRANLAAAAAKRLASRPEHPTPSPANAPVTLDFRSSPKTRAHR